MSRNAESIPCKTVCVDRIGQYKVRYLKMGEEKFLDFHCLTMINPVTGWIELDHIP